MIVFMKQRHTEDVHASSLSWAPELLSFRTKIVLVSETANFENGDIFSYIHAAKGEAEGKFSREDASGDVYPYRDTSACGGSAASRRPGNYPRNLVG
jgi:hypothetical protein